MIARSYFALRKEYQDIVNTNLELSYDISITDVDMWSFVDRTAEKIYKDRKYDCHRHYHYISKATPQEFLHKSEDWDYLKGHFKDPKFKAASINNNRNRNKEKAINQHSGPLALSYRAEELEKRAIQHLKSGHS